MWDDVRSGVRRAGTIWGYGFSKDEAYCYG